MYQSYFKEKQKKLLVLELFDKFFRGYRKRQGIKVESKVIFNSSGAPYKIFILSVNMSAKRFGGQNNYATITFYKVLPLNG